ncbi:UPF0545 protein C22orf39 homolog [Schistocerca serialis cubense]|uniref:UPF0545 protein C22orf39 homolog n=1 Tax=Schistocerca serialis cubense TaxID=2023355 RepID=UPI00214E4A77|nr:UPF0545 protein C22orf39 homolog [Schistocerca serialis cubense]
MQYEKPVRMEKADEADSPKDAWMIRPCEIYDDEYSDCASFKARFHQYFVFGKFVDCSQWKHDYENCVRWRDSKNVKACDELIKSEKKRRYERLKAHIDNDIWEKRDAPPEDWNKPLPEWMQNEYKDTYLAHKAKELNDPKAFKEPERTLCVIS